MIATAFLLCASGGFGQVSSPPGLCFSFNDAPGTPSSYLPLVSGGGIYVGFTAPVPASIERIDIENAGFPIAATITVAVHQSNGTALGALIGLGASGAQTTSWMPLLLTAPVVLTSGAFYVLHLTISSGTFQVAGDAAQPVPLPYLLGCGLNPPPIFPPCSSYPISGTFGARLRFRALACGPTPLASAVQVGGGCGIAPVFPSLSTNLPPVLGTTTFPLWVTGFVSGYIQIFWAVGPATAGMNLGLGGGCTSYLDPVSVQALYLLGLEPLLAGPTVGIQTAFQTTLPSSPGLAGAVFTAQALITGPSGVPTPFGNIQLTNALQVTLGY
jgi:hypothetical protein